MIRLNFETFANVDLGKIILKGVAAEFWSCKGTSYSVLFQANYTTNPTLFDHIDHLSIVVDDKMAAKLFSSENKSSRGKLDSFTLCIMHLTLSNMQKILHYYSTAK